LQRPGDQLLIAIEEKLFVAGRLFREIQHSL
jgi:hypothetical protein